MLEQPQGGPGWSPSATVVLGFSGLTASVGDHIGHFYQTHEEWQQVLIPYLKTGLEAGDKCVYLMRPNPDWRGLREALAAAHIDLATALASGQLVLDEGRATPEELREWFTSVIAETSGRFRLLRWGGDMTWSLRQTSTSERLMVWESMCNTFANPPAVFLCQYDLTQFLGSVVIDALKTHPLCIIGSAIHQNPFYEQPEVFLEALRRRHAARQAL